MSNNQQLHQNCFQCSRENNFQITHKVTQKNVQHFHPHVVIIQFTKQIYMAHLLLEEMRRCFCYKRCNSIKQGMVYHTISSYITVHGLVLVLLFAHRLFQYTHYSYSASQDCVYRLLQSLTLCLQLLQT